jgi:hypothetical protein
MNICERSSIRWISRMDDRQQMFGRRFFPLLEGDVTISFPTAVSATSAKTLASYVNLFLEQARLHAEAQERWREEHGRADDE